MKIARPPEGFHLPISVENNFDRIVVFAEGRVIADSRRALTVLEKNAPPAFYLPKEDVRMAWLRLNAHRQTSPQTGARVYFDLVLAGYRVPNVAWSHEAPEGFASKLKDLISFDRNAVSRIAEVPRSVGDQSSGQLPTPTSTGDGPEPHWSGRNQR